MVTAGWQWLAYAALLPTGTGAARERVSPPADLDALVEQFIDEASECRDLGELGALLEAAARELGFDYFALLHHSAVLAGSGSRIRIDNYPADWAREFVKCGFGVDDPVHLASNLTNVGFEWSKLGSLVELSPQQRAIIEESGRFGLGEGFTVPANVPGEPPGSCSFAVRRGLSLPVKALRQAELIGQHAFAAARRIEGAPRKLARPHLSRREVECLRLVALGKTDSEIGAILGISRETARQYVKHARAAYDVVSRSQLVVMGLKDHWLALGDLVGPR